MKRREPFFIIGRSRSGTTLLNRMLNHHPQIFVPQESPFIMHLYAKYAKKKVWKQDDILSFIDDLWKEARIKQFWKLDEVAFDLEKRLLALGQETNFKQLCETTIYQQAIKSGKATATLMGDKNPSYSLYVDELISVFPQSQFILVVRDPRDNIISVKNSRFDYNDTTILAERWAGINQHILKAAEKYPSNTHLVRFEDLLAEPAVVLQKICAKLNIPYESQMLDFWKSNEQLESWKVFKPRPLEKGKIDSWKSKMNEKDVVISEMICKDLIDKLGYTECESSSDSVQYLTSLPKQMVGKASNFLEDRIFHLPLGLRVTIIDTYRRLTNTL